MQYPKLHFRKHQNGVTLIEALVALLVLSIGLLGVAGLQMAALRNNHGAHLRSQATVLAYDIADRMRANRTAALTGATSPYDVAIGANLAGTALSATDVQIWKQTLGQALPAGDGAITVNMGTRIVRIQVDWTDRFGTQSFVTLTQI